MSLFSPSSQNIQGSVRLSQTLPLFVSPGGTVYAPYPFLLCAHLLLFQRIPPRRLLSPSIVPITYSAQSRPSTAGVNPPPEMNDWQVCGVSNTRSHNTSVENKNMFFSSPHKILTKGRRKRVEVEREDIILIMAPLRLHLHPVYRNPLPQFIFVHHLPDASIKH